MRRGLRSTPRGRHYTVIEIVLHVVVVGILPRYHSNSALCGVFECGMGTQQLWTCSTEWRQYTERGGCLH